MERGVTKEGLGESGEGCCPITWLDFKPQTRKASVTTPQKGRKKLYTKRLIKGKKLATKQKEIINVTKNASVSLIQ